MKERTSPLFVVLFFLIVLSSSACNYYVDKKSGNRIGTTLNLKTAPVGFDTLKSEIIDPKCLVCHDGSRPIADFTTYAGVLKKVRPGYPDSSRLYQVLFPGPDQMPPDEEGLSADEVEFVRVWISAGAPQDPVDVSVSTTSTTTTTTLNSTTTTTFISAPVASFQSVLATVFDAGSPTNKCTACHNSTRLKAQLDLTSYNTMIANTSIPNLIVAGHPEKSALYLSVEADDMPPKNPPLSDVQKKQLFDWITNGALND